MKTYAIITSRDQDSRSLIAYTEANNISVDEVIKAENFSAESIIQICNGEPLTIIAYHPKDLFSSMSKMLTAIPTLARAKITLHFCYDSMIYDFSHYNDYSDRLVSLIGNTDLAIRSRNSSVKTDVKRGRPADPKNRFNKIMKFKLDIDKYLRLGVTRDNIASIINVDRLTLEDFIKTFGLDKAKTSVEKTEVVRVKEAA
jgi:hypothetical protein